ncbi:apolipoprotein D-like [Anthonomus grandis grandis]|uniref:apolipoprotein D-like n=1 Tax=Anthonomus grandis grandis TaxID=2921223 RepID=UPI0021668351|nr:apolipoprotein D-like [Anthonomus grandis grandis]
MQSYLVLLLATIGISHSQVIHTGKCPQVQPLQNFDAASYLGTWYESQRYLMVFEIGTRCNSATYSLNTNGSVDVLNKCIFNIGGITQIIQGTANLVGDGVGQLDVYFPTQNAEANYYVIGSDYKNWAAVFSCRELPLNLHSRFAWVLTRERDASEEHIAAARAALESQSLETSPLNTVNHENCGSI